MVLSEVAERLMMMSGSDASTCATECVQSAASRNNEGHIHASCEKRSIRSLCSNPPTPIRRANPHRLGPRLPCPVHRDFVPWRFSDAVPRTRRRGLIFLAGHAVTDERQNYWFLPADANIHSLRTRAVSQDDLRRTLQGLAGKALLFLDTCHAGRAAVSQVATRGVVDINRVVNEFAAAENGVVTFASSTGREVSQERPDWGNGAFTKAIIEGLLGRADLLRTGTITVSELDAYVANRVKELTGGSQHPVMTRPPTVPDFPIAVVRAKQ
jgi:uncharacterized caspase-like protein